MKSLLFKCILVLSLCILTLVCSILIPISAQGTPSDTLNFIVYKYYEGDDVAVYVGEYVFDTTVREFPYTIWGDDGSVRFDFDVPDYSGSFTVPGCDQMFGFSFVKYSYSFHNEPTYIADYEEGLFFQGSQSFSTGLMRDDWIVQIFINGDSGTGSGGQDTSNPWESDPDITVPDPPATDFPSIPGMDGVGDDFDSIDSALQFDTTAVEDVQDLILGFGGGHHGSWSDYFNLEFLTPLRNFLNHDFVVVILICLILFGFIAFLLFGKR